MVKNSIKEMIAVVAISLLAIGISGCGSLDEIKTTDPGSDSEKSICDIYPGYVIPDTAPMGIESTEYKGILICRDCSIVDNPENHDRPCMLMYSCKDTGYGIDIQQEDGTWIFYMFDIEYQEEVWNYLANKCHRPDHLYVTVTGSWDGEVINVISMEESDGL